MSASAKSVVKARINKRAFFASLGYMPHSGQIPIHLSDHELRIAACGARFGKTSLAAFEGLAAAMQPNPKGSVGWVVGPNYGLSERCFGMIFQVVSEYLSTYVISKSQRERVIYLRNLAGGVSEIRAKTADNEDSLLGEGLDWCVMDECSRMKSTVWTDYIQARLLDKRGWCLLISTPKGKGWYFDWFRRGQDGPHRQANVKSWHLPTWHNPHVSKAKIMERRETIPERSWRQEYAAQFLEGEGEVFRNVRLCTTARLRGPEPKKRYFAGLDLARVQDYTVLIVLDENLEVVYYDRWRRVDWDTQATKVFQVLDRYNDARVMVDGTGVGDPIVKILANEGCTVKPFVISPKSKKQLVDNLVVLFERLEITIPSAEEFPQLVDELESFEYRTTPSGNVTSGAPRGQHDDTVIALALAAWLARKSTTKARVSGARSRLPGLEEF